MRSVSPWQLGGTLFVPAVHKHLEPIAAGGKFPRLRSLVIDTEDGLSIPELDAALHRIETLLPSLEPSPLLRFIRPRNADVLETLLTMRGIEAIDGFVLPKFGLENGPAYLNLLKETPFVFMPSIEGSELFDPLQLIWLRDRLLPYRNRIPLIRFGAEDMLRQLGLRRDCARSLFDMAAPAYAIGSLLSTFKPYGFEISGAVFRCYHDQEGFRTDILRDLSEGLVSKTIIHPDQIDLVEMCYGVISRELEEANALLNTRSAVFSLNGAMAETPTQSQWASSIVIRAKLFGVIESKGSS